jgi:outer membrane immunogenic protein
LFYVKGGGAWADFGSSTLSKVDTTGAITAITRGGETRSGWTVGGGIEYLISKNVSLTGEYSFVDFGTERVNRSTFFVASGLTEVRQRDNNTQLNIVKFGINYRWDWAPAAVTASY